MTTVAVPIDGGTLEGELTVPAGARGTVLFAHGSGSSFTPEGLLAQVRAPTLLIVGADDEPVIEMNRDAQRRMSIDADLEIVPEASHLFEEAGTLERVAELARAWFARHLAPRRR